MRKLGLNNLYQKAFIVVLVLVIAGLGVWLLDLSHADTLQPTTDAQSIPNCIDVPTGYAGCFSLLRTGQTALSSKPQNASASNTSSSGTHTCSSSSGTATTKGGSSTSLGDCGAYDPAQIQAAYNLTSDSASLGNGSVVAIVDAGGDSTAVSDMNAYRSFYGLPACTTANGCFHQVNQQGIPGSYPPSAGWEPEISIDLDMVSAVCPDCHILLVEANSNSWGDLAASENIANEYGAVAISNSYGGAEGTPSSSTFTPADAADYSHPGVAVVAASGDSGYGVADKFETTGSGISFPAVLPTVTAVGGTSLFQAVGVTTRNGYETVWDEAGSGCSQTQTKPSWQTDKGCSNRTVADVSAVADISTPVWVYWNGNWYQAGGTSVASPIIASVIGLGSNPYSYSPSLPYANTASFNNVASGSNGTCPPAVTYLCNGGTGYNAPTGLGTPNGIAGFENGSLSDVPRVIITSPVLGSEVEPGNLSVSGTASDAKSTIASVAISVDGGAYKTVTGTTSWTTTLNATTLSLGLHSLTVKASNSKGASSIDSIGILAGQPVPPPQPLAPTGTAVSPSEVDLSWAPVTNSGSPIVGYDVYREGINSSQSFFVNQEIASKISATSFKDTGLSANVTYYYSVAAVSANGLESPLSPQLTIQTLAIAGSPPTVPVLSVVSDTSNGVTISWTASQSNIGLAAYSISRSYSVNLIEVSPKTLTYTDTTVVPGTTYDYYVDALDLNNNFGPISAPLQVTVPTTITPPPPIAKPTGLSASTPAYNQVDLSWNASTGGVGGVDYYEVFANNLPLTKVYNVSSSNPQVFFLDASNILPLAKYSFYVDAYDYAGNHSVVSSTVNVTTPARYNVSVLKGKVLNDATKAPLSGVSITDVSSTSKVYTATTNSSGVYSFSSLPAGVNSFTLKKTSYRTRTVKLTLGVLYTKDWNFYLNKT